MAPEFSENVTTGSSEPAQRPPAAAADVSRLRGHFLRALDCRDGSGEMCEVTAVTSVPAPWPAFSPPARHSGKEEVFNPEKTRSSLVVFSWLHWSHPHVTCPVTLAIARYVATRSATILSPFGTWLPRFLCDLRYPVRALVSSSRAGRAVAVSDSLARSGPNTTRKVLITARHTASPQGCSGFKDSYFTVLFHDFISAILRVFTLLCPASNPFLSRNLFPGVT